MAQATDAQLFFTAEATPGTLQAVAGADAVHFHDAVPFKKVSTLQARPIRLSTQGRLKPKQAKNSHWLIPFKSEVKASTAAGSAPELANLFKMAGYQETITGGVSVKYAPFDSPSSPANQFACSVRKEMDPARSGGNAGGILCVAVGTRVEDLVFELNADGELEVSCNLRGCFQDVLDQSALTSPTYNAGEPFVLLDVPANNPFQIQSFLPVVRTFKLIDGRKLKLRRNQGNVTQFGFNWPAKIVRDLKTHYMVQWDQELTDETEQALWAKNKNVTVSDTNQIKLAAGSRFLTITMRQLAIAEIEHVPDDPDLYRCTGWLAKSGANPEIEFLFT